MKSKIQFCSQPRTPTPPTSPKTSRVTNQNTQLIVDNEAIHSENQQLQSKIDLLSDKLDLYKFLLDSTNKEKSILSNHNHDLITERNIIVQKYEMHYKSWRKQTKKILKRYNKINRRYHAYRSSFFKTYWDNNDDDEDIPAVIKHIIDEEQSSGFESNIDSSDDDTLDV